MDWKYIDIIFDNMEQLLDMVPDIVLVTTENALHGTVISKTLRRGIHVVVDKPLAICQTHAAEIWKASGEGKECVTNWFSY